MSPRIDSRELWSEIASIYDATRSFASGGDAAVAAVLVRELRARGAGRVLDLGCGTGRWAAPLAAAGLDIVGIDRTPEMLAAIAGKPGGSAVRVVRGDARALPFARAFDAVAMSHFLHLQPSLEPIARELCGVLRPGAALVTIDPGFMPRPLLERVTTLAVAHLTGHAPTIAHGDATRERQLLEELARGVGAGLVEAVPAFKTTLMRTAREYIDAIRKRVWSNYRVHSAADTAAAADAVERALIADGLNLDAPQREQLGVRLLIATLPR